MIRAITDGVVLMPPPFAAGLGAWSRGEGPSGPGACEGAVEATIVADPDLGLALQLATVAGLSRLRHRGETPLLPGRVLRIRTRVKALSGALPSVRIAGWPGGARGVAVPGLVTAGPPVALAAQGQVAEVSAVVGPHPRPGVHMVWSPRALFGHFGLDVLGTGPGILRIGDITIEDVTGSVPVAGRA